MFYTLSIIFFLFSLGPPCPLCPSFLLALLALLPISLVVVIAGFVSLGIPEALAIHNVAILIHNFFSQLSLSAGFGYPINNLTFKISNTGNMTGNGPGPLNITFGSDMLITLFHLILMSKIYVVNSDMKNVTGMSDPNVMFKGPGPFL